VKGNSNFLGTRVKSIFDLSLDRTKDSSLDMKVNLPEIKPILVALLGEHIQAEDITGRLFGEIKTDFTGEFRDMNLSAHLRELSFTHPDFNFHHASTEPQFIIKDNTIRKWSLNVDQPDVFIKTSGEGEFGKKVTLINNVQFNSKLFEILLAPVLSSEGFIRNQVRIDGVGNDYELTVSSKATKVNMSIQSLPVPVTDLVYDLQFSNQRLQINELKSSLEAGFVSLKGDIYFDDNSPDVNLKYVLERAEFPVMGKSSVNLTGEGIILGNQMPYNVSGDVTVNKALIVNEIEEFQSKSSAFTQIRFLPRNQESIAERLFNLNINFKFDNPARLSNSLMDVAVRGEVRLLGSPTRPRGEGRLYAPVNSSQVYFKNNEYIITRADINFLAKKEITNPDFDIQAMTSMSNYKVFAKAYGDFERFNFDLTSEPALPRNSIMSLIAFGYTDEIGNLRPEDQQNLTQMGMGSFVIEKFKISDILNKQFGIQVNVGTVFVQTNQSLLSGRSQGSSTSLQGDQGRTRSASKIELKKRLNEATTLSVSSTMGGAIGTRQSMNLNYSLNRKVQLEGVYEVRSATDSEDIYNVPISAGGDIKFRWSFK
jgi:autotransporter translocation and assembly factor TamB